MKPRGVQNLVQISTFSQAYHRLYTKVPIESLKSEQYTVSYRPWPWCSHKINERPKPQQAGKPGLQSVLQRLGLRAPSDGAHRS